jgi:hypothetical protein
MLPPHRLDNPPYLPRHASNERSAAIRIGLPHTDQLISRSREATVRRWRLHAPTRYGYKQIRSIRLIAYTELKPDDYWTKLGYDWYAGL